MNIVHQSTGTFGITIFRHGDLNREALLREADKAMCSAKNQMRGSVQFAVDQALAG